MESRFGGNFLSELILIYEICLKLSSFAKISEDNGGAKGNRHLNHNRIQCINYQLFKNITKILLT